MKGNLRGLAMARGSDGPFRTVLAEINGAYSPHFTRLILASCGDYWL
jgi:hypothetical protein